MAPRIKVQDNDESGVDVFRQALEKHLKSVNATGGRPDANRRKAGGLGARSCFFFRRPSLFFGRTDPVIVIAHLRYASFLVRKAALRVAITPAAA